MDTQALAPITPITQLGQESDSEYIQGCGADGRGMTVEGLELGRATPFWT